jgi:hypothetical protein
VGEVVDSNSVLVNKESPDVEGGYKPAPLIYKGSGIATVDKVLVSTSNESQDLLIKVQCFINRTFLNIIFLFILFF